ncbi:MAG: hypothetical protein GY753_11805, partial [Gammaproteobacteria bacterium]|nr:hypothetical protein [Gammaproteobacteria bacterium]
KQVLINALSDLKKFLAGLIIKVPSISAVVRTMGELGNDPYEASNMRGCYANLIAKYRRTEALDVATTVIVGIRDSQQGNETLGSFSRRVQELHLALIRMGVMQISISDLSAIILISGMDKFSRKAFMQSETTLALTEVNLDQDGDELEDGDDSKSTTVKGSRSKRSLYGKVLRFVAKVEDEETILGKLSGDVPATVQDTPKKETLTRSEALKKMREAQVAFAVAVTAGDKKACFEFARNGHCTKENCQYRHDVSSIGNTATANKSSNGTICKNFLRDGKCVFGKRCRFVHQSAPPASVQPSVQPSAPGKAEVTKPASRVLNSADRVTSILRNYDSDEDEINNVVLLQSGGNNMAFSTKVENLPQGQVVAELGWDSMCSLHVASKLSIIPGAPALKNPKSVSGMGGVRSITHKGKSNVFGKTMSYIEGGATPNLLSVGTECQVDDTGLPGMALFGRSGAVRFRVTPDIEEQLTQLVDFVERQGLLQGVAVLRNNVYLEAFGSDGPVDPDAVQVPATDMNCAVNHNMYANRIHLDSIDNVLDFMVASGLNQQSLLDGIKNQSLRGIPPAVTEDHVKQYFKYIGPSNEQLEAEVFTSPLSMPVDYEVEKARAPGAILQIDNVDPSFSRIAATTSETAADTTKVTEAARKAVVPSIGGYKDAVIGID